MSSGACELASGKGAKETGLQFLFRGASIVDRWGEAISTLTKFKDKTVLLFYGASWAESSKQFSTLLSKFYDIVMDTGEDALVVIFISNDKSQEAQLSFFNDSCIHKDWLMVERGPHLDEIMTTIDVERIPGLSVVGQEGTSVVEKAPEEIFEMFLEGNKLRNENDVKQRVLEKWAAWKKLAGDWDAPSGYTCGGSSGVASSSSALVNLPGVAAGPRHSEQEALRAARLAVLERDVQQRSGDESRISPFMETIGGASSSSSSINIAAHAATSATASTAPKIATLGGIGSAAAAASASGSGTFASACTWIGEGFTLAGGAVPAPAVHSDQDTDFPASDLASDGAQSAGALSGVIQDGEALTQLTSMGFPEDTALQALEAAHGEVDRAVALLVEE